MARVEALLPEGPILAEVRAMQLLYACTYQPCSRCAGQVRCQANLSRVGIGRSYDEWHARQGAIWDALQGMIK